jgi:hypothetical protein
MVDDLNQPKEEKACNDEHRNCTVTIHKFLKDYRLLKEELFDIINKSKNKSI